MVIFIIPVEKESIKYTSFITLGGQYELLRMAFALSVGPSVFNRYINGIFAPLIDEGTILTFMDVLDNMIHNEDIKLI